MSVKRVTPPGKITASAQFTKLYIKIRVLCAATVQKQILRKRIRRFFAGVLFVSAFAAYSSSCAFAIAPISSPHERDSAFLPDNAAAAPIEAQNTRQHMDFTAEAEIPKPDSPLKKDDYDFAYDAYNSGHFKTAFENAMPRAEAGDPQAQTLIGILYMEGRNVELDPQKALEWYGKAAKSGDPQAQLRYGIDIFNGLHGIKDQKLGEYYIRQAVIAGVPQAYFYYGQIMMDNASAGERADIGLEWFLRGAAAGDVASAYAAAQILGEGTAKIEQNEPQARALLEMAANGNSVAAQIELSRWLVIGRGGAKDEKQAFDLMKIVAVDGVPPAQITLARYYNEGIGTKADSIKAAAWYIAAKRANYTSDDLEDMTAKLTPLQMKQAYAASARLLNAP